MNFKNNKGYVAVDASIAILVLLIIVPTIAGMIYNVNKSNSLIDRKTEAISIAVNTIETAKGIAADELTSEEVMKELEGVYAFSDITESDADSNKKVLTIEKENNTYKITIIVQDYNEINTSAVSGKVKIVDVTVEYRSGNETNNINLNTVISVKE